jgi:hypothetical protein
VFRELLDLGLQVFHIGRKGADGLGADLAGDHAIVALFLSSLVLALVGGVDNDTEKDESDENSQDGQSHGSGEKGGKTKEKKGNKEEHDDNVDNGEPLPDTGGLSELTGSVEGDIAHKRNGVPDENTGDVKEKVGQGDLKGIGGGQQSGQDGGNGGTNVGSKSQGGHLLKTKNTHTNEGGKSRGGDGRGLDKDGDSGSNKHGNVSVDVGGLVDDTSGSSEKHRVQDLDQSEQANEKDHQTNDENDKSRSLVVVSIGCRVEESRALVGLLDAGNKSNLASVLGRIVVVQAHDGVVVIAASSLGDILDNRLVGIDDHLGKRGNNLLDGSLPLVSVLGFDVLDYGIGKVVQVSGCGLKGKKDGNGHEVEHIVNDGTGERTFELVSISHVTNGDDGVGDRSSDVGSHDHVDSLTDGNGFSTDKRNDNGGGGGRRLKKNGGKDTDHESSNGVGLISEKRSGGTSSQNLGSGSEKLQSEKEEVKEEQDDNKSAESHGPLLRSVDTACSADFTPGGILHVSRVVNVEIFITNVHGSGGAVLAADNSLRGGGDFGVFFSLYIRWE